MRINFYAALRKIAGQKTVELDLPPGSTVRQMIEAVLMQYPTMREKLLDKHGRIGLHAHVFINGRDAPLLEDGIDTSLSATDIIDIFPIGHF